MYILLAFWPLFIGASKTPEQLASLLTLAVNYSQVSKCTELISDDNILFDIPCIAPLCAEDFRRLKVSSHFGTRLHPILGQYKHHSGIDLPAKIGDNVYATANGVILNVAQDMITGKYIKIQHLYGFETLYGHLSKQLVQQGDSVRIGTKIGFVGCSGYSTGSHLHYGIKKQNRQQDPLPYCRLYLRWLTVGGQLAENIEK